MVCVKQLHHTQGYPSSNGCNKPFSPFPPPVVFSPALKYYVHHLKEEEEEEGEEKLSPEILAKLGKEVVVAVRLFSG